MKLFNLIKQKGRVISIVHLADQHFLGYIVVGRNHSCILFYTCTIVIWNEKMFNILVLVCLFGFIFWAGVAMCLGDTVPGLDQIGIFLFRVKISTREDKRFSFGFPVVPFFALCQGNNLKAVGSGVWGGFTKI
ncbi:unnamed protein product [Cuscuta epithymum]|uniref:Uncharacterized protein n=1 Tax=Cuscuta epithymum TaxID=186058 RepID=A0AAV0CC42_9ASTE|nr:unnamed protein product [Cuscuta epithymum]